MLKPQLYIQLLYTGCPDASLYVLNSFGDLGFEKVENPGAKPATQSRIIMGVLRIECTNPHNYPTIF